MYVLALAAPPLEALDSNQRTVLPHLAVSLWHRVPVAKRIAAPSVCVLEMHLRPSPVRSLSPAEAAVKAATEKAAAEKAAAEKAAAEKAASEKAAAEKAEKEKEKAAKKAEKAAKAAAEAASKKKKEQAEKEKAAIEEYIEKLNPQCEGRTVPYAERKAKREAEIAGLKEALRILEEETAFMQRGRRNMRGPSR